MNPKFPNILLAILLIIAIYSCRKDKGKPIVPTKELAVENSQVIVTPPPPPPISWLVIDSTLTPATKIPLKPLPGPYSYPHVQAGSGISFDNKYTIDLDGDSIKDIDISIRVVRTYGGGHVDDHWVKVKTLNNTTAVLTDSVYYTHYLYYQGFTLITSETSRVDDIYPRPLNYKDTLKLNDRWRNGTFYFVSYSEKWEPFSPNHQNVVSGGWPMYSEKFLGVKCNGKLAWIKLYIFLTSYVEIRQAAISK